MKTPWLIAPARKLDDYFKAVSAARKIHKLSTLSAIRSVLKAKLYFKRGPRMHAMFGLAGVPESEWKYFQYEKDMETVLKLLNPGATRDASSNKILFAQHCEMHDIAHIRTIYCDLPDQHFSETERRKEFCRCVDSGPNALFFKLIKGAHGYGAFSAERHNILWSYCGEVGTTDELYAFCRKRQGTGSGWIVQPVLKTHTSLQEISSSHALSTVRMVTCMTSEGPALMLAVLKMARGLIEVDNFDLGRGGNMVAEIDITSGKLGPAKGSLVKDFPCISSFPIDPESGHRVSGRWVPFWEEAKTLVLQAQATLPELRSLGWDVAITDQGPFVVETNSNYASEIMEVAYGRGLKPIFINRLQGLVDQPGLSQSSVTSFT